MSYTREEIRRIYIKLENVRNLQGIRLLYARDRTLKSLRDLYESTDPEKVIPVSPDFSKYEAKLRDLYTKYSTVDGVVKTRKELVGNKVQEVFDFNPDDPGLKRDKAKLDSQFEVAIQARKDQEKSYREFLSEPIKEEEVKIFKIPLSVAPEDQTSFDAVSALIADMTPEQQEEWDSLFDKLLS